MKRFKSISMLVLAAAMALPAAAADRTAISTAQIAGAIRAAGLNITAPDVTLLAEVFASTGTPSLRVESMEHWGDHKMMVRLGCASGDECLPFVVSVRLSDENAAHVPANLSSAANSHLKPVLRAGSPAILLLDGNHVHVEISVVCLENGAAGQTIHVTTRDRQQSYTAEVVDGTTLRGKL
jgi:hypothetical protein